MYEECLCCFLQRLDRMRLPPELSADICGEEFEGDFADKAREGEFLDEEVVGALVFSDFFQGNSAGFITARTTMRCWISSCNDNN